MTDILGGVRVDLRKATLYIDWVVSENSLGFHAPGESLRILNDATDAARKSQLALRTPVGSGG